MNQHRWPPLFKKAKDNKISTWQIWVIDNAIFTRSGYVGMKMRETKDIVKEGKNLGKKNETTPHDQAMHEAHSKLEKQLDRGYVYDAGDAAAGKVDEKVEGAFFPMLAHSYDKAGKKISFPCFVQPKLDGLRATCIGGKFFSRSRKPFPVLKHLTDEILRLGLDDIQLDGELYNHEARDNFEELVSAIKREKSDNPKTKTIQYHVYDANIIGDYKDRLEYLEYLKSRCAGSPYLKFVETRQVKSVKEMNAAYDDFMEQGYEGAMLRNLLGEYETRRSYNLQKLKQFQDAEFEIVGISEGRGSLSGHAAAFVCRIDDEHGERNFEAKLKGKNVTALLKRCFEDHSLWEGKWLTVQYQGFTRKNRVPRFPVGLRFREEE